MACAPPCTATRHRGTTGRQPPTPARLPCNQCGPGYLAGARISQTEVAGLDAAALPDGLLYVHLDLDVINPAEVTGLRYPAPGGPGCADVAVALRSLLATGRAAAVGIACTWRPGHRAAAGIGPYLETASRRAQSRPRPERLSR